MIRAPLPSRVRWCNPGNCAPPNCSEGGTTLARGPWVVHTQLSSKTSTVVSVAEQNTSYLTTDLVAVPLDGGMVLGLAQRCSFNTSGCDAGFTRIGLLPLF